MAKSELTADQLVVQQVIDAFGTQEKLAFEIGVDQSAVSLWLRKGVIPARRQKQIIEASQRLYAEEKMARVIEPVDFFELRPVATDKESSETKAAA